MPTKDERRAEAAKHLGLVKGLFASETAKTIESATLYEDGDGRELNLPEPRFEATDVKVEWGALADAVARALGKVCVIDPASYRTPGGNYLNGGWGTEEQICAESNLFPILEGLRAEYHDANRHSTHGGLNSDRALYLTDVMFTTGGIMRKRDVLVCAPPNRNFALQNHRSEAECDMDLAHRIETLMRIAAANGADTLVLGAFGCGFFGNDPEQVASLFKTWLDAHPGQFEKVVFSIAGSPALDAFRMAFPQEQAPARQTPASDGEDEFDDDLDDWFYNTDENSGRWVFE